MSLLPKVTFFAFCHKFLLRKYFTPINTGGVSRFTKIKWENFYMQFGDCLHPIVPLHCSMMISAQTHQKNTPKTSVLTREKVLVNSRKKFS